MGMYNEVFATCPKCGFRGYMHVSQIIPGDGGFCIDDPASLAEKLTDAQLLELHKEVMDDDFVCDGTSGDKLEEFVAAQQEGRPERTFGCGHVFNPLKDRQKRDTSLAERLFGNGDVETARGEYE